jgi:uncharacterized protein
VGPTVGAAKVSFHEISPRVERVEGLDLERLYRAHRPTLALLYGHPRIGKTFLVEAICRGRRHVYYLSADSTPELNRLELHRELVALKPGTAEAEPPGALTWRDLFQLVAELAKDEPLILVLDEFQNLAGKDYGLVAALAHAWDTTLRFRPVMLVLCGSDTEAMSKLRTVASPLHNRWSFAARLEPFDYYDAAAMVPTRAIAEAATIYSVFGGNPGYLAAIQPSESLKDCICRTVLSPGGPVRLRIEHLLEKERTIRGPGGYRAVMSAIAARATTLEAIVAHTGLRERANVIRRIAVLEQLDLVSRERNFAAPEKAAYHYSLRDLAVRFWYEFGEPNRSRLELDHVSDVWAYAVAPYLRAYTTGLFDRICREALTRHHDAWSLARPTELNRWSGRDRHRRPITVDLVGRMENGNLIVGTIRQGTAPLDLDVDTALLRDLEDLSHSGQLWACEASASEGRVTRLHFSLGGFTDRFRRQAGADPSIRLFSLDDLYAGRRTRTEPIAKSHRAANGVRHTRVTLAPTAATAQDPARRSHRG